MNQSETIASLAGALCKAQAELENVIKDAKNPHFRSDYATLAAIRDAVFPVFTKHGLSIVQMVGFSDGVVTVETQLMHSSGEWLRNTAGSPAPKQDPQGVGSACTYLRRYSLAALAGIAQEDDDGSSAVRQLEGVPARNGHQPLHGPASEKQVEFIRKLAKSSTFTDEQRERLETKIAGGLSKQDASDILESLQAKIGSK